MKHQKTPEGATPVFLLGGGVTGAHMRGIDWSATPLGKPENWPSALKTAVSLMLGARQPVYVAWGPQLTSLYNDGYLPIVGTKHPNGFGKPFAELWSEIWTEFRPIVEATMAGDAQHFVDLPIALSGRPDRPVGYFTFSYTALRDDDGAIAGFYCAATETTDKVLAERGQAAERERQRLMLDQMPGFAALLYGPEHRFDYVNDAYIAIAGPRDYIGRSVREAFPELAGQGFYELLDQVYASGKPVVLRARELQLEGSKDLQFIDFVYAPIRNDADAVAGIFVGGYEVTEAHRATAALRELNLDLERQVLERSHIGRRTWELSSDILCVTNSDGRLENTNPAWKNVLGWSREELEGQPLFNFLHPDDLDRTIAGISQLTQGNPVLHFENRYRTKTGEYRWLSWVAVPEGQKFYCSARDVTSDKAAEAERDRLWTLSEDMLARADYGGAMSAVNPAWTKVLGWSEQELLTNPYAEIIHPDDVPATVAALEEMGSTGQPTRFENRILTKSQDWKPIGWTVSPEPDGVNFIAVGRDLSDYKARERELVDAHEALRQAQKMEAVGQLTGGIAHDFNNMLAVVIGALNMMQRRLDRGENDIAKYIEAAMDGANRASSLTTRLLAFSRQQSLDPEAIDANQMVIAMTDLLTRTLGEQIKIVTVLAPDLGVISADPSQLESSLLNLGVNARDAMPDGGELTIETSNVSFDAHTAREEEMDAGQYVLIVVSDTGAGMSAETLARAFEPFFTTKSVGQGTGLGLSQVFGFVRQSGGFVKIVSKLGAGTSVKIYLPRMYGGAPTTKSADARKAAPTGDASEWVLVVEDEERVRNFSEEALRDLGYSVLSAPSGPEALMMLDAHPEIVVLFTDVIMPTMTGKQLAELALAKRPDLRVIFTTGYARDVVVSGPVLHATERQLLKPFTVDQLARTMRAVLDA